MRFWPSIAAPVLALSLALLVFLPLGPGARGAAFLDGFEDLPLMPSLSQQTDRTTVFDSPYGRIVEAYASGRATPGQVLDFYGATLPQLGWTRQDARVFRREGEVLRIEFSRPSPGGAPALLVRFEVSPD
ncbi:hypothetical protein [Caenispirillum salinarum]|uniref:hypothetical protein n=1 Tax=Caenispirillum salinarum TaxID=859058 RepID=UPI00384DDC52